MSIKELCHLFKDSLRAWHKDNVSLLAGALSFFSVFSLVPILLIALTIAGRILGDQKATEELLRQVKLIFSSQASAGLLTLLEGARKSNLTATSLVGGALLLWIALRVFTQLQEALKIIWKVSYPSRHILWREVEHRIMSFLMLIAAALFLYVSFFVDIGMHLISTKFSGWLPRMAALFSWKFLYASVSFLGMGLLSASIYRFGPSAEVKWKDVWLGAIVASFFLLLSRFGLTYYFRWSHLLSIYGAAGSILIVLLWIYFSAHIFLFGAEITWVYAHRHGSRRL